MCIFGGNKAPAPPPVLPPAPPAPLPPPPPLDAPEPVIKEVDPQVRRAKDDRGDKTKNQYSKGTGSLRIKLNPKVNTGTDQTTGGLN